MFLLFYYLTFFFIYYLLLYSLFYYSMEKNGWLKKYFFVFSHIFSIFRIRFFLFLPKRYRAILWFFYFLFISICCPRTRPNSPLMQLLFSEQPINKIGWNLRSTLNSSHSSLGWSGLRVKFQKMIYFSLLHKSTNLESLRLKARF